MKKQSTASTESNKIYDILSYLFFTRFLSFFCLFNIKCKTDNTEKVKDIEDI